MAAAIRTGIALACLTASLPALADTRFRVRQMTRNDVPLGTGQCDIRLQIDGEAEVSLRGDTVYIRTITGRDGRDDGSECNEPLPGRDVQDFEFSVRDSRGEIRLLAEPSRQSGSSAVVRIRDSKGGEGRYHFRIKWRLTGGGGRGRDDGDWRPPGRRDRDESRWDRTINYTGRGRGRYFQPGEGRRRISAVVVRIERNGRVLTDLDTDRGRVSFAGRIARVDGDRIAAVMRSQQGSGIEGEMLLFVSGDRVRQIRMDAGSGRDRIDLEWSED
jgi:hypothetical protein